jgi:hypothetical protein
MGSVKKFAHLILAVCLVAAFAMICRPRDKFAIADDLRSEIAKGAVTFFFFGGPDGGTYVTLRGSSALFHFVDESSSDNRLTQETLAGTFTWDNDQITLHGACLRKDIPLLLTRLDPKEATGASSKARFFLRGPMMPFGGEGPVELPTNSAAQKF